MDLKTIWVPNPHFKPPTKKEKIPKRPCDVCGKMTNEIAVSYINPIIEHEPIIGVVCSKECLKKWAEKQAVATEPLVKQFFKDKVCESCGGQAELVDNILGFGFLCQKCAREFSFSLFGIYSGGN